MSAISTGTGLISGLPINDLVDSLIAVQQRPITLLQSQKTVLNGRRTGLLQISSQLLAVKNAINRLATASFFSTSTAASSNESVIAASASAGAAVGDYSFVVKSLASRHQVISRGFATADATPVGAGTLTIENSAGQVNRSTTLASLNGGAGVAAGKIRITDRSGNSKTIDLVGALTVSDVIDKINQTDGIEVVAKAQGDHFILEDASGGTGSLSVQEVGGGRTASDLGILKSSSNGALIGNRINYLSQNTRLSELNDGNGVQRRNLTNDLSLTLSDGQTLNFNLSDTISNTTPLSLLNGGAGVPEGRFKITNRAGQTAEVDLTGAQNVQDVISRINATGIHVAASLGKSNIVLTDTSVATGQTAFGNLKVEDLSGGGAAAALGLAANTSATKIEGREIYAIKTVGDVIRAINQAPQNQASGGGGPLVTASISADGVGITLTDNAGGGGLLTVADSSLARDLGLVGNGATGGGSAVTSRALIAGLNTVLLRSLNGGSGVDLSDLQIGDRSGGPLTSVDLSGAVTLQDVIDRINGAGVGVQASVSRSGLGVDLVDTSGGVGNLRASGATAASLGIEIDSAVSTRTGKNLQKQYVSNATLRADFNQGAGIPSGRFRITDSAGASAVVDLTGGEKTIGDIIAEVNSRGIGVSARINDSGDGILLTDTAGGAQKLKVSEDGSTVAKALGLFGEAADGETFIDGSLETRIEVDSSDSLNDVLAKITASSAQVNASILNDGSSTASYRLNLTSARTGRIGTLAIDAGSTGLTFDSLTQARDAIVVFGGETADNPIVVSSASNTLNNVITGVKLDLVAASDEPVTISVARDDDAIVAQIQKFVDAYNTVRTTVDNLTKYDSESQQRAILQGDATARRVKQTLGSLATARAGGSSSLTRLSSVGVRLESGGQLSFDESKLRAELASNPNAVAEFFSAVDTQDDGTDKVVGIAGVIGDELDRLTNVENGVIALQEESLDTSTTRIDGRIASLQTLLESRRQRLLSQFQNMESVLANLQSQQSTISALASQIQSIG